MTGNIRSYLMQPAVVAASRDFVSIRLLTYENKSEYDYMESLLGVSPGTLPNTVFCILAPDGQTQLVRAGRGPRHGYSGARSMAAGMRRIATRYPVRADQAVDSRPLPLVRPVDLALNVAASDNRPLIVTAASDPQQLAALQQQVQQLAWNPRFVGQFIYSSTQRRSALKPLAGAQPDAAILVVEPGAFGITGKVVAQLALPASPAEMAATFAKALDAFVPPRKDHNRHIEMGYQLGIEWTTVVPESDRQSVRAKARFKARFQSRR
ncbi:MAG: thioredoxin family protein [Planctomycetota bacterium]|nr:thioredoxin family protein [Planctomycetota bacterium]